MGCAQIIIRVLQLVTSLATIGSAIAVMLFFGPFSALIGAIGLGVFAGFTGALVTILFMAGSCCMCIRRINGIVECVMSAIWAAFYLPVGAQMAVTLSAGVCAAGSAAATQAASNAPASALIAGTTQVANALLDAAAAAVASSGNRRLLLGAAARRGLLEQGLPGDIGDILSQALCAASIALTVCGFLGFVLYAVGAVLAFRCDAMKGTGLWVPKGARTAAPTEAPRGGAAAVPPPS
ncbi:hypothetical protein MNEG_8571 [Monoraphidium neglectum]|uniref:Uncharacterized protein n=1 Tax=Monoraphidium neglectum TaxID=145388 RepID=A0A0D2M7P1_9CHLO|nr:hypothetical protein MNEG_8571 [Monoraphidium neglectum]KIY99389.1 hypothetical protein MNEG_8571 [Monoraphidium neglectum]|eukprot:XP_013898409.1 hypothetical protein MNEG_8571 [Monoraphidium neglectum]